MKKRIDQYEHRDKERLNNPPVGLVTPETDKDTAKKTYAYDPHIDPSLQWAGKAEHTSFEIPTVSLHVHERIDPLSIIEAVKKKNGDGKGQMSLFSSPEENPPLRQAIDFYKHKHNWSNRLIAGDSLLVMNSLIEKEGMAGQVQMIYIDPPYGITYGSNFQPFVNKRIVKDGSDEDLTAEPEQIRAFRDTWELGLHSYLTYMRDRLLLARELLNESGSIFVQISNENLHHVREITEEVFGSRNFIEMISFKKKGMPLKGNLLEGNCDYLIWYGKNIEATKYHNIFVFTQAEGDSHWNYVELSDGSRRKMSSEEINNHKLLPKNSTAYQLSNLYPAGIFDTGLYEIFLNGKSYKPPRGRCWKTHKEGFERLIKNNRIQPYEDGNTLRYVLKLSDYPVSPISNVWTDTAPPADKKYVVQTSDKIIQRCLLMTTDPGDLVFDPTCGSGTTARMAEHWGRRWITCDTSRVSTTITKQGLMTASFEYYELERPNEGVGSGFKYEMVPHITLKSIANDEPTKPETLYDRPFVDTKRARVTGPFTVEAVPAPMVIPLSDIEQDPASDDSISRSGATLRHAEWKDELLRTGIRGKNGQYILFSRIETLPGTRWLHAEGETKPNDKGADTVREEATVYGQPQRVVISFGPEHAPLEQRQVEMAITEAQKLVPRPSIIVFAAFQFDPEAAKDIDETKWPGVTLLKAQMNADLLTEDLKKKRASNDSFWLMGQPDVRVIKTAEGPDAGKYRVEVHGFDYYNTKTGNIESGSVEKIALWMLDTDYDGRSIFPKQVFFPMAGEKDGWSRLKRTLRAEIDEDLIDNYHGTTSLPFAPGDNKKIAVKIVDDRGIESLKIIDLT
jgi:adenine-specific DNA-methyltransferase